MILLWFIIYFVVRTTYGSFSAILFTASITLFIFGIMNSICVFLYLSLALFLVSLYLAIETFRWAFWKEFYYNEVDGYVTKPPPENLILKMIKQIRNKQ